jgi:CelD/BcsL family acetyltransferase involved in cellulose biosynthesis
VRISVVRPGDLGPSEIASWRSMQRSTSSLGNPFLSPEFAIAVDQFRPDARVAVLSDGPSIAGFFPFERRSLGSGVPIAAGLTDCQGLIHTPGLEWDPRQLLRACRLSAWRFDHLVAGQGPFEKYRAETMQSPVIDLTGGFDSYYRKVAVKSPQLRRNVERKARKLAREVGELRFVPDSSDISVLRTLMALKSDQYRRTAQVDVFARPWITGLIETLFASNGSHFSGLLSVQYAGDVPLAAHFGLRCGPVLAHWFPVYDTRFSRYSPGMILHLRLAEVAPGLGIRLIDMGTGTKRYKEELKTGDICVGTGVVTRRSPLAAAHKARDAAGQWAVRTIKGYPHLFAAAVSLRRAYRQARNELRPCSVPELPTASPPHVPPSSSARPSLPEQGHEIL